MTGWFKIHRQLLDSPFWTCEPFTRCQAWIDLIGLANHADNFFYVRGIKVDIKRGQCGWSEVALAQRWKWSRTKLRKFLNDLEKEQQIGQQKGNVNQIITIINYDLYQQEEQQTGQQKDSKKTAKRQQKDINKNEDNNKNEENKKNYNTILLSDLEKSDILTEHQKITIEFWKLFKNNILSMGGSVAQIEKSKSAEWVESIRLMMEVDKITIEQLQTAYRCLNPMDKKHSEFWVKTCYSTDNLRKNFNKIIADYGNSKQTRSTGTTNEELAAVIFKHFGDGTGQ